MKVTMDLATMVVSEDEHFVTITFANGTKWTIGGFCRCCADGCGSNGCNEEAGVVVDVEE